MGTDWLRLGTRGLAGAALPGFSTLMRQAAEHEEAVNAYRRRAIALGVDSDVAEQALEEAIQAAQESPRPFYISQAEERLRRLTDPPRPTVQWTYRAEEYTANTQWFSGPVVTEAFEIPAGSSVSEAVRLTCEQGGIPVPDWPNTRTPPEELHQLGAYRPPSESHFDAIERLIAGVDTGYRYSPNDQSSFDARPDDCWRCCAVPAENDLGTCNACRDDLRA